MMALKKQSYVKILYSCFEKYIVCLLVASYAPLTSLFESIYVCIHLHATFYYLIDFKINVLIDLFSIKVLWFRSELEVNRKSS